MNSFFKYEDQEEENQEIGFASQGNVYLVSPKNGHEFAIKKIPIDNEKNFSEFEVMKLLPSSPYLLSLKGSYFESDYLNLVMEYFPQGSLARRMIEKSLSEEEIRNFFKDILEGLKVLHSNGFIHCDIKPANILIGEKGNAVICDFGLTVQVNNFTPNPKIYRGTYLYLSPEVVKNNIYTFAYDIWACAATICALGSGNEQWNPSYGSCIWAIGSFHQHPPIPSSFSSELKEVLSLCFNEYQNRPSAEQLLSHPYFQEC